MKHLMVDIETLGTKPGTVILSISAVQFDIDTGKLGKEFHVTIDPQDCVDEGLTLDVSTIMWWLSQSKEAQEHITADPDKRVSLKSALLNFNSFMVHNFPSGKDFYIWGNSARFDMGILVHAYDCIKSKIGWNHRKERDVRTLVAYSPDHKKNEPFTGVKHHGPDDCKHQIKYCHKAHKDILDGKAKTFR